MIANFLVALSLIGFIRLMVSEFKNYRKTSKRIDDAYQEKMRVLHLLSDIDKASLVNIQVNDLSDPYKLEGAVSALRHAEELSRERWRIFDEISYDQMVKQKETPVEHFYARVDWLNAKKF